MGQGQEGRTFAMALEGGLALEGRGDNHDRVGLRWMGWSNVNTPGHYVRRGETGNLRLRNHLDQSDYQSSAISTQPHNSRKHPRLTGNIKHMLHKPTTQSTIPNPVSSCSPLLAFPTTQLRPAARPQPSPDLRPAPRPGKPRAACARARRCRLASRGGPTCKRGGLVTGRADRADRTGNRRSVGTAGAPRAVPAASMADRAGR